MHTAHRASYASPALVSIAALFLVLLLAASRTPQHATPQPAMTTAADLPAEPRTFSDGRPLPRALIFDLDYTLWPLWVDTHVTPPLKALPGGAAVRDRHADTYALYPDVGGVLAAARARGLRVGAASRTHAPELAREMLGLLRVGGGKGRPARELFDALEIYPGDKVRHMAGLHKTLGVAYEDMLFFDDEARNGNVEREKGVCFQLVRDGVTRDEIDRGVEKWRKRRGF